VVGILATPLSIARAEQTLQQRYLDIYLRINDAEHLEKQGDFKGALDDFKDCYTKLAKIHQTDPNWETALVVHRMQDCQAKITELQPKADAQVTMAPAPPVVGPGLAPATNTGTQVTPPPQTGTTTAPSSDSEVTALRLQLRAVQDELRITKEKLQDTQVQLETYRTQLETVNAKLADLKSQGTVDDKMAKLLGDNKALTEKLAAAQKEIDAFKTNPKSKLALAQASLKNLQDQYDALQESNKALQNTTSTLKQQLDQAQADLAVANQKLANIPANSPEYDTIKRENEVMRGILMRELQEQAHRDAAKRLAQEEFDNLKLKSRVLQENLDILASPMTPATNDQERALLASLKVQNADVTPPPSNPNGFSAPAGGTPATTTPDQTATTTPLATTTNNAPVPGDTNAPPVAIVMNNAPTSGGDTNAAPDASATNTAPSTNAAASPASTPDPTAPVSPASQAAATATPATNASAVATPPTPPSASQTTTKIPPPETVVQDTTITHNTPGAGQTDPTQYSTKARLPDDMRDTAQAAADLFKNQKYDESAAKYQNIIDKYPESLYAWSNLGVVRFQQGKFDEALKALQQAVKLSPTDAFSYSNLGIVYYQLGQYENAIEALNSAKALDPNDAKTHNYLGCACSQKGWQEVAEKEFRKAIELDPNFGDAHFNLALVYATSKPPSLELARREYNRALELGIAKDPRLEKILNGTVTP
jgi:tetratricopeptide (TPR) repeat protein